MGRQRLGLICKMLGANRAGALRTAAIGAVLVFIAALVSGYMAAYLRAEQRGAEAAFGSYSQQITGNESVRSKLRELEHSGKAVSIMRTRGNMLGEGGASSDVTMLSGPADIGVLVAGSHPARAGEASISRELARQLGADVGDEVEFIDLDLTEERFPLTITGITENPASIREISAVAIIDDPAVLEQAEVWLTGDDIGGLGADLQHGTALRGTASDAAKKAAENAASYQPLPPRIAILLGVLLIAAVLLAVFTAGRAERKQVDRTLLALGDRPIKASLTAHTKTILPLAVGGAAGWLLAIPALHVSAEPAAAWMEQRWEQLPIGPLLKVGGAVTASFIVFGLLSALLSAGKGRRRRIPRTVISSRAVTFFVIAGTLATLVFVALRQTLLVLYGHYYVQVIGALSIPSLGYVLTRQRRRPVTHRIARATQLLVVVPLALVFVLCFRAALFASYVGVNLNWQNSQINGEESYLNINGVNAQAVEALLDRYPEIAERTAIFGEPDSPDSMFRLVHPEDVECLVQNNDIAPCRPRELDLVVFASGGLADSQYINHASPAAVGPDGTVSIIEISFSGGDITEKRKLSGIKAHEDLDNNVLSGLVLAPDSPLAQDLGEPTIFTLVISGFGELPEEVRSGIRATLITEAPYAFLVDSDSAEDRQLRAEVLAKELFALIVSGVVIIALAVTLTADQGRERRLVDIGGGGSRMRVRLALPFLASSAITVAGGTLLGHLVTWDHIPFTHVLTDSDYGLEWMLPFLGLLFLLPAYVIVRRPTDVSVAEGDE